MLVFFDFCKDVSAVAQRVSVRRITDHLIFKDFVGAALSSTRKRELHLRFRSASIVYRLSRVLESNEKRHCVAWFFSLKDIELLLCNERAAVHCSEIRNWPISSEFGALLCVLLGVIPRFEQAAPLETDSGKTGDVFRRAQ